ncbi:hypothetical protein [Allosalinactinospora lopnorensis]|uniref:hypothetical protein n=1 Tax=Allosalinactinospora lopnorensis TaxID=1352348 RepID=UPI000623CA6A|nr:hypothetical protein [Allosalinactinospora lopnorensis]
MASASSTTTACSRLGLRVPRSEDLLRRYCRTLLEALADDHGTTRSDVLGTRYAELRWRGVSFQPRTGPPPAVPH